MNEKELLRQLEEYKAKLRRVLDRRGRDCLGSDVMKKEFEFVVDEIKLGRYPATRRVRFQLKNSGYMWPGSLTIDVPLGEMPELGQKVRASFEWDDAA
jgi:hypothetical protein